MFRHKDGDSFGWLIATDVTSVSRNLGLLELRMRTANMSGEWCPCTIASWRKWTHSIGNAPQFLTWQVAFVSLSFYDTDVGFYPTRALPNPVTSVSSPVCWFFPSRFCNRQGRFHTWLAASPSMVVLGTSAAAAHLEEWVKSPPAEHREDFFPSPAPF